MTDTKELDRLDKLVAEAMGLKQSGYFFGDGRPYYIGNKNSCSPTRNAADRDIVVDHFAQLGWWIDVAARSGDGEPLYRCKALLGEMSHCVWAETPGEAVCRAVEALVEKGELKNEQT